MQWQPYPWLIPAGLKYLEENKGKEGVITLPSGMQYKVLRKGEVIDRDFLD